MTLIDPGHARLGAADVVQYGFGHLEADAQLLESCGEVRRKS
jgi:hypothetical protein